MGRCLIAPLAGNMIGYFKLSETTVYKVVGNRLRLICAVCLYLAAASTISSFAHAADPAPSTRKPSDISKEIEIPAGPDWRVLSLFSGKINYYYFADEDGRKIIRSKYFPPIKSVVLYYKLKEHLRVKKASWKWRAMRFPEGADETINKKNDSVAGVYVYFKRPARQFILKYVWSSKLPAGWSHESSKSNYFNKMRLIVLEGPPKVTGEWKTETVDLEADFRKYFQWKDKDVPDVYGVGILTDGDDTQTPSEGDYADFKLER
jgi:hypothetical protein